MMVLAFNKYRIHCTCAIFKISFSTLGHVVLQFLWIANRNKWIGGLVYATSKSVSWMRNWVGESFDLYSTCSRPSWTQPHKSEHLLYYPTRYNIICHSIRTCKRGVGILTLVLVLLLLYSNYHVHVLYHSLDFWKSHLSLGRFQVKKICPSRKELEKKSFHVPQPIRNFKTSDLTPVDAS